MMNILPILSAFGLGAIVTTAVQSWLSMRAEFIKRKFQEKKEAYLGLLNAIHESEISQTDAAAKYVGVWLDRVELVGSQEAINPSRRLLETNPQNGNAHPERPRVLSDLKSAMRKDLGVAVH